MKTTKKSPQLIEFPAPRRNSKEFDPKKKMQIITKNPKNSPGLKSPVKTPLKSPVSGIKGDFSSFLKKRPNKLISSKYPSFP